VMISCIIVVCLLQGFCATMVISYMVYSHSCHSKIELEEHKLFTIYNFLPVHFCSISAYHFSILLSKSKVWRVDGFSLYLSVVQWPLQHSEDHFQPFIFVTEYSPNFELYIVDILSLTVYLSLLNFHLCWICYLYIFSMTRIIEEEESF